MKLTIIGAGEMGKWFAKLGKNAGWKVIITDIDKERAERVAKDLGIETESDNLEAVKNAQIVIVSVPIKETPKVLREVSKTLNGNVLLVDIASVKEKSVGAMKNIEKDIELASIHPLFGPGAEDLENKNIITIPVNTGDRYDQFISFLSEKGAKIKKMDKDEHDRFMAVIQSLTHYTLLVYLSSLNSILESEKNLEIKTPMSNKLLEISKAFLRENPDICFDIQTENPYSKDARKALLDAARTMDEDLITDNIEAVRNLFKKSRKKLGMENIESAYKNLYTEEEEE